ncbi:hypothetical protein CFP65_1714 [Kitasatospora sp. MMS16-BH015]|uniref:hypothetical protein n=1 Tax=Kitasatospora sp. MMS16-BH015 TaxID=2018025 RepID=UPI000CA0D669|nr:hypothetical protein [Kitasatospora sp. MMS16-BH015]AUG76594.1 hypothetical protein CFP65_1714 [Kitasatospora sp. MMS16-BH015]
MSSRSVKAAIALGLTTALSVIAGSIAGRRPVQAVAAPAPAPTLAATGDRCPNWPNCRTPGGANLTPKCPNWPNCD